MGDLYLQNLVQHGSFSNKIPVTISVSQILSFSVSNPELQSSKDVTRDGRKRSAVSSNHRVAPAGPGTLRTCDPWDGTGQLLTSGLLMWQFCMVQSQSDRLDIDGRNMTDGRALKIKVVNRFLCHFTSHIHLFSAIPSR
ncbi:hypothetical protein Bbelb_205020 [Branchiostoma belcheri]|nr:hypothetical protein Bbelb_205020 [Branchiostoma belcheri]